MLSQFFGGIGPAIFLVLTGITLSFLMDRRERQGINAMGRWGAALRRAGYLFTLAFLFRLQLWSLRIWTKPLDRSVQGGHPQLHGIRYRD